MPERKVLVIGPSHAGTFKRFVDEGKAPRDVAFTIFAIHGAAFTARQPVCAADGQLAFRSVQAEGGEHHWNTNLGAERQVRLEDYVGVLFLDPLFILGGFMRRELWHLKKGVSPYFLEGAERHVPAHVSEPAADRGVPISAQQWLRIYETWRVGTIDTLQAIRSISPELPILLLPPVSPPRRSASAIYAYYNFREQDFLGRHLAGRFGTQALLQPRDTLDDELATLDEYHAPAPDPHHPTTQYYQRLMRNIDFDEMRIVQDAQTAWLG